MSKLSFRARALDPAKQMPIFLAEELPDLPEYSAINRAVPQMPSGMEKEEEAEHHLQRAICTGLIIPTPEVFTTDKEFYDRNYPANYKMPRQLIHMQLFGIEQDAPEYDMDSSDEIWVEQQSKRLNLNALKFEQMMDRLEKNSGQTVVTLAEAKSLLKQDDELSIAIYDYWLNKRLKLQHPLILTVKTDTRVGASSNNPYLAFRRRTEKMQTRKNRKNDETSYEKMLRLRRDLQRARMLLEMIKEREKKKVDMLQHNIDIFERRVELKDYNGAIYAELNAAANVQRSTYLPLYSYPGNALPGLGKSSLNTENTNMINSGSVGILTNSNNTMGLTANSCGRVYVSGSSPYMLSNNQEGNRKEKRQYKKRKLKMPRDKRSQDSCMATADGVSNVMTTGIGCHRPAKYFHLSNTSPTRNDSNLDTEDDDLANVNKLGSESEEDSLFAFKRRPNCDYQRPCMRSEAWPWEVSTEERNDYADIKYRYTLASLSYPRAQCIGFARRRLGRGGRVIIDRASTTYDELWSQLDYTIIESKSDRLKKELELKSSNENQSNEDSDGLLDDNIDMRFVSELMFHRRQQRLLEERINKEQTQTHYKQCFNNHQRTNNHLNNTDKCMETNTLTAGNMSPTVVVKEETAETSIGVSSADDSNEPLSSLKNKGIGGGAGDDDDEENVNLAELSNLIKHSNATNQNQKSDMKAADKLPYICTAKDLVLYSDDDVLSSTLNDMEDVAREKSFLPKRKLPPQERLGNKRSALLNYSKVFNGIYNDWLHFRPHHNINELQALSDCEKNVAAVATEDTLMEENYEGEATVSSSGKVGHSVFKISLPNSQLSPPTLLQLKAPAQLLEEQDLTKEEPDLSLVKDEVIVQPFPQISVSNNTKQQVPQLAVSTELLLPEQTKTKNILFHMQNNNIATNNGKTIGKLIPALQQMSDENKTKLNPIVYATSSAYGQKIFIQKAPMAGVTPYSTAGINIVRKEGISDETLPQYSIVKQKKNMLSTGPLLFTTGNLTQLAAHANSAQNSNTGENIIVSNQVNTAIKHSLPTTGTENKEILNSQKKILFANLISSSVPRNPANYGDENTDSKPDTGKTNIIQSLQPNESGTTIIDGTAITRYVSAAPNAEHGQKKLHMRGGKLFKMSSRPFLVTDSQQKIKLEDVDKEKTQLIDRRLSTSGTSTLPSNSYFLTPITSAVQLKTDNDNKGAVSLHGQKIKVNFLVKDGDNKALNIAQNQIVQANSGLSQSGVPSLTGDKRIIYTSVLNVKALPKNNGDASQTLEPATSNGLHVEAAGDSRVVKNKTILRTSLHSAPVSGAVTSTGSGLYSVNNRYNVVKISGTKTDKNLNNKTQSPNNNARSNTYAYIKPDANKNIVIVQNFNCNNVKNENNGANRRNQKKEVANEDKSDSVKDNEEKFAINVNVNGNPTVVNDKRANNNNNNNNSSNKTNVDNRKPQEEELSNNNDGNSEKNSSDMPTFPVKRKSINQKKTENKSKIFKESSSTDMESNENIVATSSSPKTTDQNG